MPWRNGGGITTEIAIAHLAGDPLAPLDPAAAEQQRRFLYRVSIADVASDGPFSRFGGYDRHIMLLEGAGMTIDCGAHGSIDLTRPLDPRTFSGDWDVVGALVAGPVRDFNLMVDRATASSSLEVRAFDRVESIACPRGDTCVIHVLEGALEGASAGDTLVIEADVEITPRTQSPRVVIGRINRRASRTP